MARHEWKCVEPGLYRHPVLGEVWEDQEGNDGGGWYWRRPNSGGVGPYKWVGGAKRASKRAYRPLILRKDRP